MEDKCTLDTFNSSCVNCPEITCQFTKYEKSGGWFGSWMSWYNIFGFFWAMEFVTAFGEMVMAGKLFYIAIYLNAAYHSKVLFLRYEGVFAKWYWTFHKKDVPIFTLGSSLCNVLTFHLGTIAFGSLIIGIIRFVRAILQYIVI